MDNKGKQKDKDNYKNEIDECQRKAEEYLNNWRRERADFINYKKGESDRMTEFIKFANEGFIIDMIGALDDLYIAKVNFPEDGDNEWLKGFDNSIKKLEEFLYRQGVEKIKVKDNMFDPLMHEAIGVGDKDGQNLEEIRSGYIMHGKVIRPARVKIIS